MVFDRLSSKRHNGGGFSPIGKKQQNAAAMGGIQRWCQQQKMQRVYLISSEDEIPSSQGRSLGSSSSANSPQKRRSRVV
jgi:homoserine kinase